MCRHCMVILAGLLLSQPLYGESHWETIRGYMEAYNQAKSVDESEAAGLALINLVNSLSKEELLNAARQCSQYLETTIPPEEWGPSGIYLGFFMDRFPEVSNNFLEINDLLQDLTDRKQPTYWRWAIVRLLCGSWRSRLTEDQCIDIINLLIPIYNNEAENVHLRSISIKSVSYMVKYLYEKSLKDDPKYGPYSFKYGPDLHEFQKDISNGNVVLDEKTSIKITKMRKMVTQEVDHQLLMFRKTQMSPLLHKDIIEVWVRYHDIGLASSFIKEELSKAIQHYELYNEEIWVRLIAANMNSFENPVSKDVLSMMIDRSKDPKIKSDLKRFQKSMSNQRIRQNEQVETKNP